MASPVNSASPASSAGSLGIYSETPPQLCRQLVANGVILRLIFSNQKMMANFIRRMEGKFPQDVKQIQLPSGTEACLQIVSRTQRVRDVLCPLINEYPDILL